MSLKVVYLVKCDVVGSDPEPEEGVYEFETLEEAVKDFNEEVMLATYNFAHAFGEGETLKDDYKEESSESRYVIWKDRCYCEDHYLVQIEAEICQDGEDSGESSDEGIECPF
jgi:hypothetical protein